jgi:hypothetical protein
LRMGEAVVEKVADDRIIFDDEDVHARLLFMPPRYQRRTHYRITSGLQVSLRRQAKPEVLDIYPARD